MKKASLLSFTLLITPLFASAAGTVQDYIIAIGGFLNTYVIPFFMSLALLFFVWGIAKYFIMSGASEEGRTKGKSIMLWGFLAFVFILSIWGIVNMIISAAGLSNGAVCPDYYPNCK